MAVLIVQAFSAGKYPGFEAFDGFDKDKDHIMLNVINKKLTQALGRMIPLSRESSEMLTSRTTYHFPLPRNSLDAERPSGPAKRYVSHVPLRHV